MAETNGADSSAEGSRLTRALLRLSGADVALPRVRRTRSTQKNHLISIVLQEIDECILPRDILLIIDEGAVVRLSVSNRRLMALRVQGGPAVPEPGDPESVSRLFAKILSGLLDKAKKLEFRFERCDVTAHREAISCSAASLARSAGVSLAALGGSPGLGDYRKVLQPSALAWLHVAGPNAREETGGDRAALDALRAFTAEAKPTSSSRLGSSAPTCLVLPLPDDRVVISAAAFGEHVVVLLPKARMAQAINAWQKRF